MTWNPIVHMGWLSLGVFALIGIAWGAMPVNPSRFRGRHGDALVTAAGPAMPAVSPPITSTTRSTSAASA